MFSDNIIFVNAPIKAYSVHMTGLSLWKILQQSKTFKYWYIIPESYEQLTSFAREHDSRLILYNHLNLVPEWLTQGAVRSIAREGFYQCAFLTHGMGFSHSYFDAYLIPDPTIKRQANIYPIGRPLPPVTTKPQVPHEIPVIGTAGHLLPHKQFPMTVDRIIKEFDQARIRILMPTAEMAQCQLPDAEQCIRLVQNCGKDIQITIDTECLPIDDLVDWLAGNDLNVYWYSPGTGGPAPSLSPDPALSARRPIAVTKQAPGLKLFHNCHPSICVEDSSLKTIMQNGIKPLDALYIRFSDEVILSEIQECLKHYVLRP